MKFKSKDYRSMLQKGVCGFVVMLFVFISGINAYAETAAWKEESISFQSEGSTLNGTILIPDSPGPHPGIALVHGSNSTNREKYRAEAELFVKAGIVTLIYDKRSDGFSKSRTGSRSYELLAKDAAAAVGALRARADVQPEQAGLWGISEGAWVASLAASESADIKFLIMAGASGVPPVQQQSWQLVNRLYDQGVTSWAVIQAISQQGIQLAVSAGMFAEAEYNPVPVFERLKQPILAIWGANDRIEPALESSQIVEAALQRGGNSRYRIQFFPGASHLLRESPDGIQQLDTFAPGYGEAMITWIARISSGSTAMKPAVIGTLPLQNHISPQNITNISWVESAWVQLGTCLILMVCFSAYLAVTWIRVFRNRHKPQGRTAAQAYSIWLAGIGSLTVIGFIGYFGFLMSTGAKKLGPVVFDRPLVWIMLQILALAASIFTVLLARSWWFSRGSASTVKQPRMIAMGICGLLLILWTVYWRILI